MPRPNIASHWRFMITRTVSGLAPDVAADLASRATATYSDNRSLKLPSLDQLRASPLVPVVHRPGRIYLAAPFFDLAQRWLVEEARSALLDMGMEVFSPVHQVGPGAADIVAPKDLQGLEKCHAVFAIVNGLDPGTLFEIGFAVKLGIPVVALAENVRPEDLKMLIGTGCDVVDDFTTAIYHSVWSVQ